jgi:hypothetical protein
MGAKMSPRTRPNPCKCWTSYPLSFAIRTINPVSAEVRTMKTNRSPVFQRLSRRLVSNGLVRSRQIGRKVISRLHP